jgi:hypothetical protein
MLLELTAPKNVTFIISVALAVIAAVLHYANIPIPGVTHSGFVILLLGYLVLLAGNVFRGV